MVPTHGRGRCNALLRRVRDDVHRVDVAAVRPYVHRRMRPGDPSRNHNVRTYRLRLLLFLSALLTGLTGLLPGVGVANARQVAAAQAVAGQIAVAIAERPATVTARPIQPLLRDPQPLFLTPAPHVAVRDRTLRTHE